MKCPACGFDNPAGFAFCGKCGARLAPAEPPPELVSEADLAWLRSYLPPAKADELPPAPLWENQHVLSMLEHLSKLLDVVVTHLPRYLAQIELDYSKLASETAPPLAAGEFLSGTLLFADISGFTAMSEKLSTLGREGAEQITDIVNRYFDAMINVLLAYGGDLFKFGGDALLAFFPDAEQPGSVNALYASWEMQQAMSAFRQVKTSLGTFPLQMKIGLNAGRFFAARLGTADERQFLVTGAAVNDTARAESLAQAGQILAGPAVHQQAAQIMPVTFRPGPDGRFWVDHVSIESPLAADLAAPTSQFQMPIADLRTPVKGLRFTLKALDRLKPYLPAGLLPRLISKPTRREAGAGSEHRLVGILFANFMGASELVEKLGLGRECEIARALNQYYVAMQQAIARYGGVVNKTDLYDHGDKLMALFGAPVAHEDDAERAVRAALDMQAAEKDAGPMLISQRIGVSTGVVFAGHVGSARRREYTVMGDEVNLAARLMSAAGPGGLLLSGYVRRKVSPFFDLADHGEVMLKGKSKPVPTFTIVGRKAQPEPVRGIQGLRSPLVGRDQEAAATRAMLDALCAGRGGILSIIGEAGLGKSRLLAEWKARSGNGGQFAWLEGQCLSFTQNISYSAFNKIIHDALGILETDSELEAWAKLRNRVEDLMPGETGQDVLPYLAQFLSLPLDGPLAERVKYLEGEALQRQVLRAVSTLLEHMAQQRPLVLVFDDLHWADSASLALLERCLGITDRAPALICMLYRPDRERGCWALGQSAARNYPHRYNEIILRPLDVQAGQDKQLVCNLLSVEQLPPTLAHLIARAEGNPFYIEEIIRTLIDAGAISRDNSHWRFAQEIDLRDVPHTLQGIIMARLDRLAEEARRTLQLASVVGRSFRYSALNWLTAAVNLAARLGDSLAAAQRASLVRELARVPELEYGFAQALFRDVAYESLLVRDRRNYHRLVGQHLEETHAGKLEEIYELLAHHYSLSDDRDKALAYLVKAGDKTRTAYANQEAIALYRQAETLAGQLDRPQDKAVIAGNLGDVLFHVGEYDQALACYERALGCCLQITQQADLHRRIGAVHEKRGEYDEALASCARGVELLTPEHAQSVEMARLLALRCRVYQQQGNFEQAIEVGEQGLAIIQDTLHYQEIAQAHNGLGNAYEGASQPNKAIHHFEKSLDLLKQIGDEYGAAKVYNNLAIIYYQTDLPRSAHYFNQILKTSQRFGDVWVESTAYQNLGAVHYARGDYDQAIDCYQRSFKIKEYLGDNFGAAQCHINLGEAYRAQNDLVQAITHLEKGLVIAQEIGATQAETECHRQLAECCLEMNEAEGALVACQAALEHARKMGDRKEEGIIYRVMGNASLQLHKQDAALAHFEQSASILSELNREFDLGMTLCDYAQALKAAGQTSRAREQLLEAIELFDKLQLPQEQARAQAALDQLE